MIIKPNISNSIDIELEDGSIFRIHHSIHGNREKLFISAIGKVKVEKWKNFGFETLLEGENSIILTDMLEG